MILADIGMWLWTTIAIFVWVAIALWPARVAARKGHSWFLFFCFSLICFPIALLVAYLIHDRARPALA